MAGNDQVTVHKRAAAANERDYNFGLGKRAPDWKGDSTEYDSSPESGVVEPGIRLHPQLLAQLTQLLNEQQQKRSDQLNRYAFGLGKIRRLIR